mmetsp:Transcript_12411/g.26938  ORF Transcript_12411/g.26938 Transcript_12411/m.26938 type:complete len:109 (-) Transcript_12411:1017-1343(-)
MRGSAVKVEPATLSWKGDPPTMGRHGIRRDARDGLRPAVARTTAFERPRSTDRRPLGELVGAPGTASTGRALALEDETAAVDAPPIEVDATTVDAPTVEVADGTDGVA